MRQTRSTTKAIWSAAAAVLLGVGFCTASASAHTAPITADCEAGLQITLFGFNGDGVNTLRVWIDGADRASTSFGAAANASFSFGDLTVAHTWRVSVAAWDDPTGANGWSFDTGTRSIGVCSDDSAPPVDTSPASTATTVATSTPPDTTMPSETSTPGTDTTAAATTTVASTPTTVDVSTSVASGAVTTTTISASGGPVTSVVAQAAPTSIVAGTLPVTGPSDARPIGIALLMFGFGILLIVATRRPDTA